MNNKELSALLMMQTSMLSEILLSVRDMRRKPDKKRHNDYYAHGACHFLDSVASPSVFFDEPLKNAEGKDWFWPVLPEMPTARIEKSLQVES